LRHIAYGRFDKLYQSTQKSDDSTKKTGSFREKLVKGLSVSTEIAGYIIDQLPSGNAEGFLGAFVPLEKSNLCP
jgi:hypothetical protein